MKAVLFCLPLLVVCGCSKETTTHAADKSKTTTTTTPPANKPSSPTASAPANPPAGSNIGTAESAADRELADRVRKTLRDDEELSDTAMHVSVSVKDGKVTLRGNVPTQDDKKAIVTTIKAMPGVTNVDDQLEVRPG